MVKEYPVNITFNKVLSNRYIDDQGCHNTVYETISIKGYKSSVQSYMDSNDGDSKEIIGSLFVLLFPRESLEIIKEYSSNKSIVIEFYKACKNIDLYEELKTDSKEGQLYLEHDFIRIAPGFPVYIKTTSFNKIKTSMDILISQIELSKTFL